MKLPRSEIVSKWLAIPGRIDPSPQDSYLRSVVCDDIGRRHYDSADVRPNKGPILVRSFGCILFDTYLRSVVCDLIGRDQHHWSDVKPNAGLKMYPVVSLG